MKSNYVGLKRLIYAAHYSIKGLVASWESEAAIRQEIILASFLLPITFFLDISSTEQVLLIFSLVFILIVELLNTALETTVDRIGCEFNTMSGKAKDIGSAAVFVSLLNAILIWTIILC